MISSLVAMLKGLGLKILPLTTSLRIILTVNADHRKYRHHQHHIHLAPLSLLLVSVTNGPIRLICFLAAKMRLQLMTIRSADVFVRVRCMDSLFVIATTMAIAAKCCRPEDHNDTRSCSHFENFMTMVIHFTIY